jgi:hypothetical protein
MHSTYKFTSKDVIQNKDFNFMNWLKDRAEEILKDSKLKLMEYNITPEEEHKLLKILIEEKGMTLHFYFAGSITEADVKKLRGYSEPKKIKDEDKCPKCKILLTSKHAGKVENGICEDCNKALVAINNTAKLATN